MRGAALGRGALPGADGYREEHFGKKTKCDTSFLGNLAALGYAMLVSLAGLLFLYTCQWIIDNIFISILIVMILGGVGHGIRWFRETKETTGCEGG